MTPFLTMDRATELAFAPRNIYSSFPCHKTTEYSDMTEDMEITHNSKECAGFLTLRATETYQGIPDGFEPSWDLVYESDYDMISAYEEHYGIDR